MNKGLNEQQTAGEGWKRENASSTHTRRARGSGQGQLMLMLVLVSGPERQGTNALCHPWLEGRKGGRHRPIRKMPGTAPASPFQAKRDALEEVGTALPTAPTICHPSSEPSGTARACRAEIACWHVTPEKGGSIAGPAQEREKGGWVFSHSPPRIKCISSSSSRWERNRDIIAQEPQALPPRR